MMTSADKVGGWVKKGQNHDDVILEWSLSKVSISMVPGLTKIFSEGNITDSPI